MNWWWMTPELSGYSMKSLDWHVQAGIVLWTW